MRLDDPFILAVVPSESRGEVYHTIRATSSGLECSCEAYQKGLRRPCKHILGLRAPVPGSTVTPLGAKVIPWAEAGERPDGVLFIEPLTPASFPKRRDRGRKH